MWALTPSILKIPHLGLAILGTLCKLYYISIGIHPGCYQCVLIFYIQPYRKCLLLFASAFTMSGAYLDSLVNCTSYCVTVRVFCFKLINSSYFISLTTRGINFFLNFSRKALQRRGLPSTSHLSSMILYHTFAGPSSWNSPKVTFLSSVYLKTR